MQPGCGSLQHLHLSECAVTADQLVDLVRLKTSPYALPLVGMTGVGLKYDGEAPGECPATPDEQPVSVTDLVLKWGLVHSQGLNLAGLEAVTHVVNVETLTLYGVSYHPIKQDTFN